MSKNPASVLFVGAHHDDVEIGCGGTVAKLAREGHRVSILVLTREANEALADQRQSETIAAASAAGISGEHVHFLNHRDGFLEANRDSVGELRQFLAKMEIDPHVVFVHTDQDSHKDHRQAYELICSTFRKKTIICYRVVNSGTSSHFFPNVFVDTTGFQKAKNAMLRAHRSQEDLGRIRWSDMEELDTRYAKHVKGTYCEAFSLWIQEGAASQHEFLTSLNDDRSARQWLTLLGSLPLTVILGRLVPRIDVAYPGGRTNKDYESAQLIADNIANFNNAALYNRNSIKVIQHQALAYDDEIHFERGNVLLIGGSGSNNAVLRYFNHLENIRYHITYDSPGYRNLRIQDRKKNKSITAVYKEDQYERRSVVQDIGILTVMRNPYNSAAVILGAMGIHGSATRAAAGVLAQENGHILIEDRSLRLQRGEISGFQMLIETEGDGMLARERKGSYYEWN